MLLTTLDIDWASEAAIEETLLFLERWNILPTVFTTHRSQCIEQRLNSLEVGLHPFFDPNSSHGSTIEEVVNTVLALPHNIPAFRCHRFSRSNEVQHAMSRAGMKISSNVCTDLETLPPFRDRNGLLEVPIFLEDGGYLHQKHPLRLETPLKEKLQTKQLQILLLHPMHIVMNTPHFDFMKQIKNSVSREEWNTMDKERLDKRRFKGWGIRNFLEELFDYVPKTNFFERNIAYSSLTSAKITN